MRQLLRVIVLCLGIVAAGARAEAVPLLQLDIVGGHYDSATQTIVSNGPVFQLIALFTPKAGETFDANAWYYVSAAVVPQTAPPGGNYGSFTWDDDAGPVRTVNATSQMEYGVPPIESAIVGIEAADAGDLPTHGIYPTYFTEFAFKFDSAHLATTYDTSLSPSGLTPSATGGSYYHVFDINVSGLTAPISGLHFDLYDTIIKTECMGPTKTRTCTADEDVDHFAPFSHDAQSGPVQPPQPPPPAVPEPASLLLLATGLVISARTLRRRPAGQVK